MFKNYSINRETNRTRITTSVDSKKTVKHLISSVRDLEFSWRHFGSSFRQETRLELRSEETGFWEEKSVGLDFRRMSSL